MTATTHHIPKHSARRYRSFSLSAFTLALGLVISGAAQADMQTYTYGQGRVRAGQLPLKLDFYPGGTNCDQPRPTALLIHGGGFAAGSRSQDEWIRRAQALTAIGFNAASMDYRMMRDDPLTELQLVHEPDRSAAKLRAANAAFEDAAHAMQWLADQAETLCIDPQHIALVGASAGAVTALYLAYAMENTGPKHPKAMAVISLWGGYLPAEALGPGKPPLLIVHGKKDPIVPYAQATALASAARNAGLAVQLFSSPQAGHGVSLSTPDTDGRPVGDHIFAFLVAAVKGQPIASFHQSLAH